MREAQTLKHPDIAEIRGRGLFIAIELLKPARAYCERLMQLGLLCKETHEYVIRLAPPLIITEEELDFAFEQIQAVFANSTLAGELTAMNIQQVAIVAVPFGKGAGTPGAELGPAHIYMPQVLSANWLN